MNNEQFRRLLFDNPPSKKQDTTPPKSHGATTPAGSLGSRMRSSVPMTPRTVTGQNPDFARQLAEHRRQADGGPPTKKFKSSYVPKGTKLPSGYHDRALERQALEEKEDGEDVEKRLKALEEMVKLGQIDQATFEKLRAEMGVGGNLKSTHMVKGLDWDLLRKIRAGENVEESDEKGKYTEEEGEREEEKEVDVDEEFEKLLEEKGQKVLPAAPREKKEKKGNMAPPPATQGGQKMSRDQILAQLKASRAKAASGGEMQSPAPPAESTLGSRFKKVGESKAEKKRWVEQDASGRRKEILLTTDAEGKTKRKVKWLDKPGEATPNPDLLAPSKKAQPLGMEVPAEIAAKSAPPEEEDDDIFEGVGADYNPLGDIGDEFSDSDEESEVGEKPTSTTETALREEKPSTEPSKPRNYFATSTTTEPAEPEDRSNPLMKDPTLMVALKRAATLRQTSPSAERDDAEAVDSDAALRRKKFLEEVRRREAQDAMDMDLGFGGSRIEDEEDDEAVVLEGERTNKRKRGPKKRKGNKESASDVMRVLERRKKD
ncbi:hypothetical protein PHISCL_01190 [Aspergillus sclerotialis]|uniref:RED-like N-terminal domain-containing protein n=1 Tax=Aspergillus sclerotialis TaxID=2070753 RepID=A0A3A2ZUT3_9EURO|nr:hypothetical protein PHISCL_01190 [Aspergillus sclerotialis]